MKPILILRREDMYIFNGLKKLSIGFIISINVPILLLFEPEEPVHVNVDGALPVRIRAPGLLDDVEVVAGVLVEGLVQDGFHGIRDCGVFDSRALQD